MLPILIKLVNNKFNLILIFLLILLIIGGFFCYQRFINKTSAQPIMEEIDLNFDPEGPYALLLPRRDGNALILNLKRTASYDKINYELAYTSEGIDRGVMGEINAKDKKGEYEQEILFGTCSKNVCKYDKDVENGTLTLRIQKGNQAYRMITQWHLQKPTRALGKLTSGDGHLVYNIAGNNLNSMELVQYTIINDLSGAPKLPKGKQVVGKVYTLNTPIAKVLPAGLVTIEQAQTPPIDSKIACFDDAGGWKELETKIEGNTLTASTDHGGIFAVFASQ